MIADGFLHQMVTESIRGDPILDVGLVINEDVIEELVIEYNIDIGDYELIQFKLHGRINKNSL